MTYAPELPGAAELVSMLAANGVTPSLGHTDADAESTADSLAGAAGVNPRPRRSPERLLSRRFRARKRAWRRR